MAATIHDIPIEILVLIFEYLNLSDIEFCLKTCYRWKDIIAQYFMKPHLQMFGILDEDIEDLLYEEGWTCDCNNTDFIVSLYEKVTSYKGKIFMIWFPRSSIQYLVSNINNRYLTFYGLKSLSPCFFTV